MAELRYITIPPDIQPEEISPIDGASWSWARCVEHLIRKDTRFNDNGEGIRAGARILKQLTYVVDGVVCGKKPGMGLDLDQADWRLLHDAFERPMQPALDPNRWRCAYLPAVHLPVPQADGSVVHVPAEAPPGLVFLSYIEAVSDEATKKKPEARVTLPASPADQPS